MRKPRDLFFGVTMLVLTAASSSLAAAVDEFVIEDVTVIDGTGRTPTANQRVVVRGGKIAEITRTQTPIPTGVSVVDGRGKFLISGMIDAHIHLLGGGAWRDSSAQSNKAIDELVGESTLQGYLYYGFTSVYDAGNNPDFIMGLRARERAGEIIAPRIFATGQLLTYPGSWSVGYAGSAYATGRIHCRISIGRSLSSPIFRRSLMNRWG